jgi:hypothetical protein
MSRLTRKHSMNSLGLAIKAVNHANHSPDYTMLVEAKATRIKAFMDEANEKTILMIAHDAKGRNDTITLDALVLMDMIEPADTEAPTDH